MTYTGIIKGNVVVLEENACLPDEASVEVRLIETATNREDAFERETRNSVPDLRFA